MSAEEFWQKDPRLAVAYRRADKLRQQRENRSLWLQGMYIYDALVDVAPLINPMAKKPKALPYPEQPYPMTKEEREERELEEAKKRYESIKKAVMGWADEVNRKMKGGDGDG